MRRIMQVTAGVVLALLAAGAAQAQAPKTAAKKADAPAKQPVAAPQYERATFAGGCFWCMQPPFDKAKGVASTTVGYTGGRELNPTYEQVGNHKTSHREAIEITYDPRQISYSQLLEIFWHNIDPTQATGQFADIGHQYTTAIYYHSEEQRRLAEASKAALEKSGKFSKPLSTEILPASRFWPAEEYHQKYYLKNPGSYNAYKIGSGRAEYIERTWGKP